MGRSRTFQILLALAGFAFVACNDKFMAQSARSKTSALAAISTTVDEAGNISGTIDPSASATQLLKFSSGELAGSAIAIPPGALSIPVSVTVGAGESLSSSQFLQDIGITNNSISAAGPSVAFTPSQPVEATNPLTLSIPFSSGSSLSLTTSNDNIVVLYRWTKVVNGESSHSMGIIPAKDVVIAKDKVSFQTTKFGVFQLGKAETKIVERVNVQSVQPPAPKRDVSNPLVGTWGVCQNVMMASADAPDWSSGNGMEWFESTGVAPEFDSQVTDGKDYKPKGCSFIGSDGDRSPALPLPLRPGENMPIVLCDGATDGEHGGGDFFGANPRSPMISKAVNLKITNGAFTMIEDLFESINCAADTRISSTVQNGGIGLPAKDFLKDTHPIDVTIKSRVGVMFTDAGVTAANRISPEKYGCGLKGWVKGQRMDLKDSSCGGDMGQTKYERIKIIGDRLYFCEIQGEKDSYGKTPEMRIPSCDINGQSFFLKRQ